MQLWLWYLKPLNINSFFCRIIRIIIPNEYVWFKNKGTAWRKYYTSSFISRYIALILAVFLLMLFEIEWPSVQFILLVSLLFLPPQPNVFSPACSTYCCLWPASFSQVCLPTFVSLLSLSLSSFPVFLSVKSHFPCSISFFFFFSFLSCCYVIIGFKTDRRLKNSHKIRKSLQFYCMCVWGGCVFGNDLLFLFIIFLHSFFIFSIMIYHRIIVLNIVQNWI